MQPVDIRVHEQCRAAVSSLTHVNSGGSRVVYLFRARQVDDGRQIDVKHSRSCFAALIVGEVTMIRDASVCCVMLLGLLNSSPLVERFGGWRRFPAVFLIPLFAQIFGGWVPWLPAHLAGWLCTALRP
ncbi:hypothetical protein BI330_24245 [Mycobacterium sp. CBMA 623]|nr:hypothetical protein [Mycobacteroides sp. CBMA 326]